MSSMYFKICYILYYLPLEIGMAIQLDKFEFPLPKDALCQFW